MSEIKVNKISPRSGTTVTLGDSGDTFTIPSGATINNQGTATNFGATGSASWTTTVKTNSDSGFTAVAGEGYFLDTSSGTISVNLPAGSAGAVVAFKDYAGTFDTNKVTLVQNGSDKIGGSTINATLETEGIAVTLVFIDSTQGWLVTDSGLQEEAPTASYIAATGGTVTTVCTNFKVHTFTGPGTFCVSAAGNSAGSNTIDYLVVGGGAAGQTKNSRNPTSSQRYANGGGGAGGVRVSPGTASGCWTASPLGASPAVALPVGVAGYPVTVGAGSSSPSIPQACSTSGPGSNSILVVGPATITATGGGGGGYGSPCTYATAGGDGGSGGGGGAGPPSDAGGSGNTPPTNPPQGQDGGLGRSSEDTAAGGGGGAGGVGAAGTSTVSPRVSNGGAGGAGVTIGITGSDLAYAGGGGGGAGYPTEPGPATRNPGPGGSSVGGAGGGPPNSNGGAATANRGGGGGGAGGNGSAGTCTGGAGGSGVVIIRYKFQ
jgi:hypothetical protein